MKNQLFKKVMATVAATAIAASMAMPAAMTFAAPTDVDDLAQDQAPSADDLQDITVRNVEDGATVKAYKIVGANYGTNGLTGYSQVIAGSMADITAPTEAEIEALSKNATLTGGESVTLSGNKANGYTAKVPAGMYLVLVSKSDTATVYNPMIVANDYTDANSAKSLGGETDNGEVDSATHYHIGVSEAWAKSSTPTLTKTIVQDTDGDGNTKGDSLGMSSAATRVGDTVSFKIVTQMPSYSDE